MNGSLVVDASVAVKVLVPEPESDRANALFRHVSATQSVLYVPPHFLGEVVNAVYQRLRTTDPTKHLTEVETEAAMRRIRPWPIEIVSPTDLYEHAFAFAKVHAIPSFYDSLYVTLAQMIGADLWTADQRLLAMLADNAPWVKWIGDYRSADTT